MKKLLLVLFALLWAGCSDDSGSSVNANGCRNKKITRDEVCDTWNEKYDANACWQLDEANRSSMTIEVCD